MLFRDITLVGEGYEVQEHRYLATRGNRIESIASEAPAEYEGEVYEGRNKVLLPGFYNLHCHVPMTLIRGYGEGLPLHRWLHERMFPFEALMTAEDMYWGTLLGMAEMLRSGAVSFTDMYMELEGICRAVDEAGMKANLSHGTNGFSEEDRFRDSNGWRGTQTALNYVKGAGHDRIVPEVSIHAEYTSQERILRDVADFALENGLRAHIHLSETMSEHEECKRRRGGRTPAEWFRHCGMFRAPTTAAHCVWLEGDDFSILAEDGVTVAHCPSSNLKLGSGIANVKKMLNYRVRVAIGTDGAASNNNLNMLEEVNLASLVQKGVNADPLFLGPKQMLELACRNGALAQGREDCGCIRVGNRADLVVYDLDRPYMRPVFDPLSNVLYAAEADAVLLTMVDGRVLYRDGAYPTIDLEQALFHAERIKGEKLAVLEKKGE